MKKEKNQNKHKIYALNDLDANSDTESIRAIKKKKRKEARAIYRIKIAKDYEKRAEVDDSFVKFLGSLTKENAKTLKDVEGLDIINELNLE